MPHRQHKKRPCETNYWLRHETIYKAVCAYLAISDIDIISPRSFAIEDLCICYEPEGKYDMLRVEKETGDIYHNKQLFEVNRDIANFALLWACVRADLLDNLEADVRVFSIWRENNHLLQSRELFVQDFISVMAPNGSANIERMNYAEIAVRQLKEKQL